MSIIKSVGNNQHEIIADIMRLFSIDRFDIDPTYSKGNFYKNSGIAEPLMKFDINPVIEGVNYADAKALPLFNNCVNSVMFDPPFIVGKTEGKTSEGLMQKRFGMFARMPDLWNWYSDCLTEFYRILNDGGKLVFKCQDTIADHKQFLSHVYIINCAEKIGFYTKDLFVLTADNRMIQNNLVKQEHARKYHSYFIVFEKCKQKVSHLPLTR